MPTQVNAIWNRREFLQGLSLAGAASAFGLWPSAAAAEPAPETTTIRLIFDPEAPAMCYAPQYVAEQFLGLEGFTDVRYVPKGVEGSEALALLRDQADISASLNVDWIAAVDDNRDTVVLSGLHAGCIEVFANERVQTIRDLKGKRVAVNGLGSPDRRLLASVAAYIGLDPERDIEWVYARPGEWAPMLAAGDVDGIVTFPPMSYDVRDKNIGHVILNTTTDEPWRHYFCCMIGARREFVQRYPVATKRALRAMIKANQLCSLEPQRTAQWLVDRGYASNYEHTLLTLTDVPYGAWRDYDPADTLRFYALRLREAGLLDRTPEQIIERGTDWRFLDEIKRELRA